ncbi:hypothetical protein BP00DRAFT_442898 [Aspergillus indologenus CBS 114.80]|uniref:Uncharacterized protein n=1 Tax=Aspergillus indologenus CBS 114.80 TaxID=1450541 RepID=A0A2V5J148_9EURO|nr:hypothetical protein BP00DRAFT_442898 [Aspergillus indologenus CBS 114.80]
MHTSGEDLTDYFTRWGLRPEPRSVAEMKKHPKPTEDYTKRPVYGAWPRYAVRIRLPFGNRRRGETSVRQAGRFLAQASACTFVHWPAWPLKPSIPTSSKALRASISLDQPLKLMSPRSTQDLDKMDSTVLAWQRDVPPNLCSAFSAGEIAHIFSQRLKIPFGVHDAPARAIAISILPQLQTTLSVTGKAVKFAMLPVLVPCVELTTQTERDLWLVRIPELVCCSKAYGLYIQGAVRAF